MKKIATITDKDILGTEGLSLAKPRLTARAILRNDENQYAVMYASEFNLYSLPGGGIEEEEDILDALRREIREETGCHCETIVPLGYVEENRAHQDYTTISHYYVVTTHDRSLQTSLTDDEIKHGTVVGWHTLEDAYHRIADICHPTVQRKFLQARDLAALRAYMSQLSSGKETL